MGSYVLYVYLRVRKCNGPDCIFSLYRPRFDLIFESDSSDITSNDVAMLVYPIGKAVFILL